MVEWLVLLSFPGLVAASSQSCGATTLGCEVQSRVLDSVARFLDEPRQANRMVATYLDRGGFSHHLDAQDRKDYIKFTTIVT